ncbi:MAG TPA: hypothetical protein ENH41_01200 [Candidatus Omnitrophica bacterium]|nr:hypothetical protein [Candidatus Omnitrophota bacterium]
MKKSNKAYEIKIYENGPHGFIYKNTDEARDAWDKTINFFDKYFKKEEGHKESAVSLVREEIIESSPFGFHPACVRERGALSFKNAQDIGIKWHRTSRYLFWMIVQRDLNKKEYDFSSYDRLMQEVPSDMHVLMNIAAVPVILVASPPPNIKIRFSPRQERDKQRARQYVVEGSYLPADTDAYSDFVRSAVERYDGDGIEDMPGLKNPVKVWQVDNEPPRRLKGYAKLLKITYNAIKEADPEAKVMIGGATGSSKRDGAQYISKFNKEFLPILEKLNGKYMDIFDFHWYGDAIGDYRQCKKIYNYIRMKLSQAGFSKDLPVWITEMGTYSGKPLLGNFAYQSEKQQAIDLIKRYVYPLSFGIKKVFLAFGLMEGFRDNDNYFEHTGLVYNGRFSNDKGRGVKKLAYYTYKKMTEVLEGSDWDNIQVIQEEDGIYIYKFSKQGKPIWVAWNDNEEPKRVTITLDNDTKNVKITEAVPRHESGKEVKDYNTAFRVIRHNIMESYPLQVEFELEKSPVYVEVEENE